MAVPSVAKWMLNPLIVLNMGSEMVYILQQRLKAQKIATDKACRVLMDTVSALFELKMIESTFRAQATFSSPSVRELFHRITHCSIMRLNDESMDKLYDLMMMGLKVQLIRSRDSYELIESTLHRIDNIHSIIDSKCASCSEHSNLLGVIQSVRRRVTERILRAFPVPNCSWSGSGCFSGSRTAKLRFPFCSKRSCNRWTATSSRTQWECSRNTLRFQAVSTGSHCRTSSRTTSD